MTDGDALMGTAVGLIGLGIAAGVANRMMQPQPVRYRTRARAKPIRMKPIIKHKKKKAKVKFMY
jgi:hypothetical protein